MNNFILYDRGLNGKAVQNRSDYFSLSVHLLSVGWPLYDFRFSVSSVYNLSAMGRGMPSHTIMRTTITAVGQWWPVRCRTKQRTFSSSLPLLKTWKSRTHLFIENKKPTVQYNRYCFESSVSLHFRSLTQLFLKGLKPLGHSVFWLAASTQLIRVSQLTWLNKQQAEQKSVVW